MLCCSPATDVQCFGFVSVSDFRIIPNSRTVLNGMRVDRLDGLTSRTVEIVNLSKRRMERNVEQVKTSKGLILLKIEILNVPRFQMGRRAQLVEIS
ncbi:hypothetical protein M514_01888 [Trichuris suis]|uniref:Uncharacterized protein n=1 Tax=Trichuris suis TaxID=68888 RepID=A0A085NTH0_9BILA|nr:hypothetical protein M514_01888 [Trichuris suis]